jgi:hypothetical protein
VRDIFVACDNILSIAGDALKELYKEISLDESMFAKLIMHN